MSSVNHKAIQKILEDGVSRVYSNAYKDIWKTPIEIECYKWLEQAYPNIYNEFKAVYDIQRED